MFRRLAALPASIAGLLVAHESAYRIVATDGRHRHALLDATGHGWLGLAPMLVAVAALAVFTQAWRASAGKGRTSSYLQILGVQSAAYAVVEIGERVLTGHNPWPGLGLLVAGAVVQIPAALLVWALLRFVVEPVAEKLRNLFHLVTALEKEDLLRWQPVDVVFATRLVHGRTGRAPPSFC